MGWQHIRKRLYTAGPLPLRGLVCAEDGVAAARSTGLIGVVYGQLALARLGRIAKSVTGHR